MMESRMLSTCLVVRRLSKQMDSRTSTTDSAYLAISGEELRDVVRPELLDEYDKDVANWLVTDDFSARTGGLFKPEFIGFRGVFETAKCYFVEGKDDTKYSCKGMSKKQNEMTWQRYMNALKGKLDTCLLYTSPSPRDGLLSRMPSSA